MNGWFTEGIEVLRWRRWRELSQRGAVVVGLLDSGALVLGLALLEAERSVGMMYCRVELRRVSRHESNKCCWGRGKGGEKREREVLNDFGKMTSNSRFLLI